MFSRTLGALALLAEFSAVFPGSRFHEDQSACGQTTGPPAARRMACRTLSISTRSLRGSPRQASLLFFSLNVLCLLLLAKAFPLTYR